MENKILIRKRAKKVETDPIVAELRIISQNKKYIIGAKEVLRVLKQTKVERIYIARNALDIPKVKEVKKLATEKNIPIYEIKTSLELGQILGKPFLVTTVAII